jgi:hypothetical protein
MRLIERRRALRLYARCQLYGRAAVDVLAMWREGSSIPRIAAIGGQCMTPAWLATSASKTVDAR